jgi:hypothetical protein
MSQEQTLYPLLDRGDHASYDPGPFK